MEKDLKDEDIPIVNVKLLKKRIIVIGDIGDMGDMGYGRLWEIMGLWITEYFCIANGMKIKMFKKNLQINKKIYFKNNKGTNKFNNFLV